MKTMKIIIAVAALGLLAGSLFAQAADPAASSPAAGSVVAIAPSPYRGDTKNVTADMASIPSGTPLHLVLRGDGQKMVPVANFTNLDAAVSPNVMANAIYYVDLQKFNALPKAIAPNAPVTCNVYEDGRAVAGLHCISADLLKSTGLDSSAVAMTGNSTHGQGHSQ
jgi:hypothetical protein